MELNARSAESISLKLAYGEPLVVRSGGSQDAQPLGRPRGSFGSLLDDLGFLRWESSQRSRWRGPALCDVKFTINVRIGVSATRELKFDPGCLLTRRRKWSLRHPGSKRATFRIRHLFYKKYTFGTPGSLLEVPKDIRRGFEMGSEIDVTQGASRIPPGRRREKL